MSGILEGAKIVISEIGWNDIADIAIISFILYKLLIFIRDSRAQLVFKGVMVILAAYVAANILRLQMLSYIVDIILRNAAVALIFVFQPEIRSVLERVGRSKLGVASIFERESVDKHRKTVATINSVVESARVLKKQCMGALIVFEREVNLSDIINTGTKVDAEPNSPVIANIFYNKAPLHDGAVIIRDNRIYAAGCILPLTQRADIDPNMGTRHRAAIGMSENSDAVVVVVSEESGRFTVVVNGNYSSTYDSVELYSMLMNLLAPESLDEEGDAPTRLLKKGEKLFDRLTGSKKKEDTDV